MFIQTEATPNPQTLKFIPGKPVIDQGNMEFLCNHIEFFLAQIECN